MTMTDELHLAQTEAFINENPSTVRCMRAVKTPTGTGGYVQGDYTDQGARLLRVVGQSVRTPTVTPDGRTVVPIAVGIALPEDDWMVGDRFDANGLTYEVVMATLLPPWRKRLDLINYG